jgi:phenylpropionate dioxygenase-like ring-hydroxylating dioxygenase large terminal subunit
MTTAMNVLRRLSARQPATGLPREFYVDERVFELDLELIFYRQWLFAARVSTSQAATDPAGGAL